MTEEESLEALQADIQKIIEAKTDDFVELGNLLGLDPKDLAGADLSGTDLRGAIFSRAILGGANLRGADLSHANLRGADLRGANLSGGRIRLISAGADLNRAKLRGANLRGADLSGANLGGANLRGADLRGANLRGAAVTSARFGDNKGITQGMKQDLIEQGAIFEDSPGERSSTFSSALSEQVRQYLERDPKGLGQVYCRSNPQATFQAIALKRLDGESWQQISDYFGIPVATLSRFFQHHLKRLSPKIKRYIQGELAKKED